MPSKKAGKPARKKVAATRGAGKSTPAKRSFDDLIGAASVRAAATARALRVIVREVLPGYEENIYGSAKSPVALYSSGDASRVLCGIQASGDDCLFYIHHAFHLSHPEITFQGKGKHARQVRYRDVAIVKRGPLVWLLSEARRKSGYN